MANRNFKQKWILVKFSSNLIILDLKRLWIRNLGRDDRSITSNEKECRFPFLDLKLISVVKSFDPKTLTDFSLPKGLGDKLLLRKIAFNIGLK